ncbi:hypothetical protein SUGI_1067000 [Cryptomeria japonica]|uniref:uncharacterized protein LOC131036136 n=1 Tax=Cryptomeria japonica TaxID=3369 RepID=UPI002414C98B|nr:uncharacterized protein LOC131036136 [Cryptomeria japonica]GLJ50146.1 hypothetical protein SUGI_1067000 [Cryptomeria japonica]
MDIERELQELQDRLDQDRENIPPLATGPPLILRFHRRQRHRPPLQGLTNLLLSNRNSDTTHIPRIREIRAVVVEGRSIAGNKKRKAMSDDEFLRNPKRPKLTKIFFR